MKCVHCGIEARQLWLVDCCAACFLQGKGDERADLVLTKTPIGFVTEHKDRKWVFIGWLRTTVGHEMWFVRAIQETDRGDPFFYHASMAYTLIKKFPTLEQFRKLAE